MTEVNFNDLLKKQIDTVERPKNFPINNYDAIIAGHEHLKSSQKETPFVRFWCKLLGPQEDVDADLFEEAGGLEALAARKPIKYDFYITEAALPRLREFLEDSLCLNCEGRNFDTVIPESTNVALTVTIKHDAGTKPGDFWMNISDSAKAA